MGLSYLSSSLQETARQSYVDLVSSLSSSSTSSSQVKPVADKKQQEYENLVVTSEDGITKIILNRPTKKNAINTQVTLPSLGVLPPFFPSPITLKTSVSASFLPIFVLSYFICAGRLEITATSLYNRVRPSLFRICELQVGSTCPKGTTIFPMIEAQIN